jgi:preprotein translocase subunit Sss1
MIPTPEEERFALTALFSALGLAIIGAFALIIGLGWVLGLIANWVF